MSESGRAGLWGAVRLVVFLLALLLGWGILRVWARLGSAPGWQRTDDAYLQTDLTPLAAKVAGYVAAVPVDDYQRVVAGQVIARIDDRDYRAAVAGAEADVAAASAAITNVSAQEPLKRADIDVAGAILAADAAALDRDRRAANRAIALKSSGAGTEALEEDALASLLQVEAQRAQHLAQQEGAVRALDVLRAQGKQSAAALAASEARLDLARLNLSYTAIVAPAAGMVGQRLIRMGQYLSPGQQVIELVGIPNVWVIANYKETQVTHLAIGQRAKISVDAFPGVTLRGHVVGYAPASGSQFALLPPDNATGNFTKVVQRIGVKIIIDDSKGLADKLRPGMSVIAVTDMR